MPLVIECGQEHQRLLYHAQPLDPFSNLHNNFYFTLSQFVGIWCVWVHLRAVWQSDQSQGDLTLE
jgi:hypothetical protein